MIEFKLKTSKLNAKNRWRKSNVGVKLEIMSKGKKCAAKAKTSYSKEHLELTHKLHSM